MKHVVVGVCTGLAFFFSLACDAIAARNPIRQGRYGITRQGVQVVAHPDSPLQMREVQRVVAIIIREGLCFPEDVRKARVMLVLTPFLGPGGNGSVVLGQTFNDNSIVIAALSDLLTSESPYKVLIHEFAHVCQGDGQHKNAELWEFVDAIFAKFLQQEKDAGRLP